MTVSSWEDHLQMVDFPYCHDYRSVTDTGAATVEKKGMLTVSKMEEHVKRQINCR